MNYEALEEIEEELKRLDSCYDSRPGDNVYDLYCLVTRLIDLVRLLVKEVKEGT